MKPKVLFADVPAKPRPETGDRITKVLFDLVEQDQLRLCLSPTIRSLPTFAITSPSGAEAAEVSRYALFELLAVLGSHFCLL